MTLKNIHLSRQPTPAPLHLLLDALHVSLELNTAREVGRALQIIMDAQACPDESVEALSVLGLQGPLQSGSLPGSSSGLQYLLDKGWVAPIVVNQVDGYYACTHLGASVCRVLTAGM